MVEKKIKDADSDAGTKAAERDETPAQAARRKLFEQSLDGGAK